MAINRGARASSHPTPSHFMATLPPTRPLPLHFPHKHTLAQGLFGHSSIVRPPILSLFVRSSDRSWFVRPIIQSFVRSFVQIIVTTHHYYLASLLFSNTIHHCYYSSLLFTDPIHHRYYSSMMSMITFSSSLFIIAIHRSSDHPKFQLLIHHAVQST
jgi:hypothetical protein